MTTSAQTLKFFRQLHRYIGLFISPALLFFALTGALQTFSLHETTRGSSYVPPSWIATLAQLHKHQTTTIPVRKPAPTPDKPKTDAPTKPAVTPPSTPQKTHLPMKIFFLAVTLGLFTSTLTGIYMSYKYGGSKVAVTLLLLAGIVVPLLLLKF